MCLRSYTSTAGMSGVFTTRPVLDILWGYDDSLLQLLTTLLPPGTLQDGSKVGRTSNEYNCKCNCNSSGGSGCFVAAVEHCCGYCDGYSNAS